MADKTIGNLTAATTPLSGSELLEIEQGGNSRKVTFDDAAIARFDASQTFSKPQRVGIVALADGATITPNLNDGNAFSVMLGGNRTFANPSNISSAIGQEVTFIFRGTYQPSFGSYYKFPGGTAPAFSGSLNVVGGLVISSTEILCFGGKGMA